MARYAGFNINKKRRANKPLIAVLCAAAAVLVILFIIGVTAGSDSEESARMSTAVRENTELKAQVSEMTEQIDALNKEIADLRAQLEAMPTLPPAEETSQPDASPSVYDYNEPQSPREGFR